MLSPNFSYHSGFQEKEVHSMDLDDNDITVIPQSSTSEESPAGDNDGNRYALFYYVNLNKLSVLTCYIGSNLIDSLVGYMWHVRLT